MNVTIVRAEDYNRETIRASLKKAFRLLELDDQNPLGNLIKPGNKVFIKPNWVAHCYRISCPAQYDIYTTITHPAVIKEVALFVDIALQGKGKIMIGDNPSIDADFEKLMKLQDLEGLKMELNTPVYLMDLRPLKCVDLRDYGKRDKMVRQQGDPEGITTINLGRESMLYGMKSSLFRGIFNEREECVNAHTGENQLYSFSNSIFNSDVYISIPKLKTHHKVGATLNLKGLVGAVSIKDYLVHWREGFPLIKGDAYPDFWHWFSDKFKKIKKRGAWSGNDTIWRMVVDLYTCMREKPKKHFSVIDGILGGEGNGPFCPEPKESKVLLAGFDLLLTDIVGSRLMGFDVREIPYLNHFLNRGIANIEDINIASDCIDTNNFFINRGRYLDFKPPDHWLNLIERIT